MAELRLPALEVTQSAGRILYSFAVDGKQVPSFATVSRVRRGDKNRLDGYQRPEVISHIQEIRNYLESPSPMVPNAAVIAFDSRVRFEPALFNSVGSPYSRNGTLVIPLDAKGADEDKPGFIVDGQQRLAAIREARIDAFPICVTAFITNDVRVQTEQFILVNSTKPLPKGLLYELLPGTDATLPTILQRRRFPAHLANRLNHDEASPFFGKIQTPTNPDGVVKDNSILRMLENSLSDGALYRISAKGKGEDREEEMLAVLFAYWSAVSETFEEAWSLPPKKSRLTHGAGIVSLGFLMDTISDRHRNKRLTKRHFAEDLSAIKSLCRWTDGVWDFGRDDRRSWRDLQNTSKDIELLTSHLLRHYKKQVWDRDDGAASSAP